MSSTQAVFPIGPRRVLLVEGGRSRADELAEQLDPSGRDFVVESIWTSSELRGRLALGGVHLVLLDPELPDSRGLLSVQDAVRCALGVPVVVLGGEEAKGFEVKCLLAGAARVLRRDEPASRLAPRVLALLGVSSKPRRPSRPSSPDANPQIAAPERPPPATHPPVPRQMTRPEPSPPDEPETMAAELWWHEGDLAAIWCSESLRIGLRCEMLLDPDETGRPELYRVEVTRAHHKCAPDGRNGYLHEASVVLAAHPAEPPAPPRPEPPAGPFRVVLVEDNSGSEPSPLRRQLGRKEGVFIETRSSLAGLRARLRRDGVHLVLLGLDLPDSQGLATVETALGYTEGAPVVALVTRPDAALEAGCLGLGVAQVLSTSLQREALHALIDSFREVGP